MPRRTILSLSSLALLGGALSVAAAQGPGPQPCPTAGVAATDAKNDQSSRTGTPPANVDITQYFFRTDKNVTTANIRVQKLDKTLPSDPTVSAVAWFAYWTDAAGTNTFVSANLDRAGAITYEYGTRSGSTLTIDGSTKGQFIEGPDGVVSITLPAALAKAGSKLATPNAQTSITNNLLVGRLFTPADLAPDSGGGKDYTVTSCDTAAPASPTPAEPTPAPPSTTPAPSQGQPATGPHALTLVSRSAKARGKKLSIKVRSTGKVSNVVASLKKGSKIIATGKKPEVNGTATLQLKAGRKIKRGSYVVTLEGTGGDGQRSAASAKLKVK